MATLTTGEAGNCSGVGDVTTQSTVKVKVKSLHRVRLFETPWTVAHRTPLAMGFPGKNTGVGCHFILQGILPTQGLNPGLLHCRHSLPFEPLGNPVNSEEGRNQLRHPNSHVAQRAYLADELG